MAVPQYDTFPYYDAFKFGPPIIPKFYWDAYSQEQRIKRICIELHNIVEYANSQTDRMNQYQNGLVALENAFNELKQDYKQFRTGLEQSYQEFKQTFEALKRQVDDAIEQVENEHAELDRRLNQSLTEWRGELSDFKSEMNNQLNDWQKRLRQFEDAQAEFEATQQSFQRQMDNLTKRQGNLETRMGDLENDMDSLEAKWRQWLIDAEVRFRELTSELRDEIRRLDKALRNQIQETMEQIQRSMEADLALNIRDLKLYADSGDAIMYARILAKLRLLEKEVAANPAKQVVRDPTEWGFEDRPTGATIFDVYEWLRYFALTARGQYYYSGFWTAEDLDNLGLSARDYDTASLFYLSRHSWKYQRSPVTGEWRDTQRNLAELAALHGNNWTAQSFDEQNITVEEYEMKDWTAFYADYYCYLGTAMNYDYMGPGV